jgi:hypothetical protein
MVELQHVVLLPVTIVRPAVSQSQALNKLNHNIGLVINNKIPDPAITDMICILFFYKLISMLESRLEL